MLRSHNSCIIQRVSGILVHRTFLSQSRYRVTTCSLLLIQSFWVPFVISRFHRFFFLQFNGIRIKSGAFLSSLLVPEGGRENLLGVASVLVFLDNLCHFVEQTGIQGDRIQSEIAEFAIGDVQLVFGCLLAGVGDEIGFYAGQLGDHFCNVSDTTGLGNLVENFDPVALFGRVVDGNFNASGSVSNVNESTGLASCSIHGQGHTHGALHEETVQNGSVVSIVVESVDQAFVQDGLGGVGTPHNALVQVSDAKLVILLIELPKQRIQALGGVVDRSRMSRV
mmetsp:Transcript_13738/g.22072  ORF Transcript_13738/g.22072 Transcript_13738/m.22072 type:complete len:280 (-) Transcript_13738:633-1472(-)